MTFEDLQKVNETLLAIDVKGKDYVQVNERVKAFRSLYPEGSITTELLSNNGGVCVIKATVGFEDEKGFHVLATGIAYEKEGSSFINKTSYIENCETSAIGRALGFVGLGIETSIASAEEVQNAILNQNKADPKWITTIDSECKRTGKSREQIFEAVGIKKPEELTLNTFNKIMKKFEVTPDK